MVDSDIQIHMLRSYIWLRRMMIIVTALFLVALLWHRGFSGEERPDSISAYYYHAAAGCPLNQLFVASLCAVGVMLITYQGYTDGENLLLNIAGYGLIGVVFFPMDHPNSKDPRSVHATIHYLSAVTFFVCIAAVSVFYARNTLSLVSTKSREEAYRRTYHLTGTLMIALPVTAFVLGYGIKLTSSVFWVEVAGVLAFLSYWLVKSLELESTKLEKENKLEQLPAYSPPSTAKK